MLDAMLRRAKPFICIAEKKESASEFTMNFVLTLPPRGSNVVFALPMLEAGNKKAQALAMYLAIHVKVYQEDRLVGLPEWH